MTQRIWELDALRGLMILAMAAIHLVYDLVELWSLAAWDYPAWFSFLQNWGGAGFFLLSGICATLGSRSGRRGTAVLLCGMVCSLVTATGVWLGIASGSAVIYFGVLHCLGCCMVLWTLLRQLPDPALAVLAAAVCAAGLLVVPGLHTNHPYLIPLGITFPGFSSPDYFPLLPFLGFFLLGAWVGRKIYREKTSLLPRINPQTPGLRFLRGCGRHSLAIYLLHQPVFTAGLFLASRLADRPAP